MHHLDRGAETTRDRCCQFRSEERKVFTIRRSHVCWQIANGRAISSLWKEPNQLGQPGGAQPREAAAIVQPPHRHASIAINPVPSQVSSRDGLAAHGLHRVPEEGRYFTDVDSHAVASSSSAPAKIGQDLVRIIRRRGIEFPPWRHRNLLVYGSKDRISANGHQRT